MKKSKDHGAHLRAKAAKMMPDVASMMPAAMSALGPQAPQMPQAPMGMKKGGKISDGLRNPIPITPVAKFAKGGKSKKGKC